jgi:hypothetical protein
MVQKVPIPVTLNLVAVAMMKVEEHLLEEGIVKSMACSRIK